MDLFTSSAPALSPDVIRGNAELVGYFSDALENERLPHAHILEGPKGSGRHTLVYAAAAALARMSGADGDMVKRIEARQSPDISEYGLVGTAKSVGIDTIRAIKEAAYITPSELEFKLFIIDDAHLMTVQAQNALLKLLEEPPKSVYFMLLCGNIANILTTVRSRAPTLRMQLFDDDELDRLLCEDKKFADIKKRSPESFTAAIRGASGSYGAAAAALSSRSKKDTSDNGEVRGLLAMLDTMPSQALLYAAKLPSKRDELYSFLSDLLVCLRDLALLKRASAPKLLFYADRDAAEADADRFTVKQLVGMADVTSETLRLLDSNVNVGGAQLMWLEAMARKSTKQM